MAGFNKFLNIIGIETKQGDETPPGDATTKDPKSKASTQKPTAVKTTSFDNTAIGQATQQTQFSYTPTQTDVSTYSGTPTQQALDYFANFIKEHNLTGNDYQEFIDATLDEGLKAFPTEQNRFIAAFVGFKRDGLTREKIVETAAQYQAMIDEDLKGMDVAFEDAYKEQVEGRKLEMEKRNARMQELSLEIEKLNAEAQQLNQEAMESENTLQSNKNSFALAAKITKEKIAKDIDKINQYLAEQK